MFKAKMEKFLGVKLYSWSQLPEEKRQEYISRGAKGPMTGWFHLDKTGKIAGMFSGFAPL